MKDLRMKLERVHNYGMHIILTISQPPRSSSEVMKEKLKRTALEKRREMAQMLCVRRCVKRV